MKKRVGAAPTGSWDSIAPLYDAQLWLERSALGVALDLAAIGPGDRVVDVGTGTGGLLRALRRRGGRPDWVLGIDRSAAMLDRVPALPEGWRLARADATRIPLCDGSVDVALAAFVLHLLGERKRRRCLRELRRVVAPGGRIVVVVPAVPAGRVGSAAYRAAVRLARVVSRPLAATLEPVDLRGEVADAGLRIVATRRSGRGYPARCLLLMPLADANGGEPRG
ncbi:MAG: methyltransferase domain-containing protein [Gaiellales bacterium]